MKIKTLAILITILVLPLIIIGSLLQIISRLLLAISYLFWFDRYGFLYEIRRMYEDIKIWNGLK